MISTDITSGSWPRLQLSEKLNTMINIFMKFCHWSSSSSTIAKLWYNIGKNNASLNLASMEIKPNKGECCPNWLKRQTLKAQQEVILVFLSLMSSCRGLGRYVRILRFKTL